MKWAYIDCHKLGRSLKFVPIYDSSISAKVRDKYRCHKRQELGSVDGLKWSLIEPLNKGTEGQRPVWPDDGIKSSPTLPKMYPKSGHNEI